VTPAARQELGRLLGRAVDGDRAALDPLFAAAWPVVRGFCRRLVGDDAADDAAQETMVKLYARLPGYDRERDALTWILTLATWECRTLRRRHHRRREELGAIPDLDGGDRPDELIERRQLLAAVADVAIALSPADAATLAAAWTDDDAARAAVAPATFRKRLERALARFRTAWRSRHGVL
jgi:RNA polymerase sigma-70 factor (ECF subfamily)